MSLSADWQWPTFRHNPSVPSWRVKGQVSPLKVRPIGCFETSVTNYQSMRRKREVTHTRLSLSDLLHRALRLFSLVHSSSNNSRSVHTLQNKSWHSNPAPGYWPHANIIEQQLNPAMSFPDDVPRNDTVQPGTHCAPQPISNIWYDMMWYDMIWCDMIWCDMIWYMVWYDMMWYDMIWYMVWYDMMLYDMIYGMIWYDIFNCNWVATRWQ